MGNRRGVLITFGKLIRYHLILFFILHLGLKFAMITSAQPKQNQLVTLLDILVALLLVAYVLRVPDMIGQNLKSRFGWTMLIVYLVRPTFFRVHVAIGVKKIVDTRKMLFSLVLDTFNNSHTESI